MRRFPEKLLARIRSLPHQETRHAAENKMLLGLSDEDVVSIAETAEWWQTNKDEKRPGKYKYEMIGRDTYGRRMYTAGKEMTLDGEEIWFIVTIHEAD